MSRSTLKLMHVTGHCSSSRSTSTPSCPQGVVVSQAGMTTQDQKEHCSSAVNSSSNNSPVRLSATTKTQSKTAFSASESSTPMSCFGSPDNDEKRAAAAEARRRRRLVLARRQNSVSPRRASPTRRRPRVVVVPFAGVHDREPRDAAPRPTCYPLIQPTVDGLEAVAKRWKNGLVVAIPTECTYEACLAVRVPKRRSTKQPFDQTSHDWMQKVEQLQQITKRPPLNNTDILHATKVDDNPTCLVTPGCELKRHPILRESFTPKLYALRPSDTEKTAVMHRFNESMEVLERLASKLWPGPFLIRLGISSRNPWTRTPFVLESRPPRIDENNPNNTDPAAYNNFVSLRCPRHPLAVKARKDVTSDDCTFLVSLSVQHDSPRTPSSRNGTSSPNKNNQEAFCTRARQVASRMAVLDGEDCREVFHVPTCEYGRPCESSIWLDGRQRVITVQSASPDICSQDMVRAALRHPASKKSCTKKERMLVQAILSKWKVVCATPGDVVYD